MAENNSLLGLKIMDVLRKHSDKDNPLTQQDIVRLLKSDFGTEVDRKTVGRNIAVLVDYDDDRHIGYKTSKRVQNGEESETRTAFYYKSDFEAGEMRVLIDSIEHLLLHYKCSSSGGYKVLAEEIKGFLNGQCRYEWQLYCMKRVLERFDDVLILEEKHIL